MMKITSLALIALLGLCSCSTRSTSQPKRDGLSLKEPIQIKVSMSIQGLTQSEKDSNTGFMLTSQKGRLHLPSVLMRPKQVATVEVIKEHYLMNKASGKSSSILSGLKAGNLDDLVVEGFRSRLHVVPEDDKIRCEGLLHIGDMLPNEQFSSVLIPYSGIAEDGKEIVIPARGPSGKRIKIYVTLERITASGKPVRLN